ncbi:helix-turn-helix domain-containing protein [Virgibacillus sp. C22-A2]|uniref:Helix-turn-helix domain-containing protein n=1 Tax=Virgibacillus tibetensis TaxID=3042313 RepID=A0ABU6KD46_9BACI|nr:helix-turn-helix domain-containing protein [Virgibacillus sp. C22-A2]
MLFEGIILTCSTRIKTERTAAAIFHIVSGKKSIQTIQDIRMFELEDFYGIFKNLPKPVFDKKINELDKLGLLQEKEKSAYDITKSGKEWLERNSSNLPLDYYNGLHYSNTAEVYNERLTLLIQTLTNSKKSNFAFIPVIENSSVEKWVKFHYKEMKVHEARLLSSIYNELRSLLRHFSNQEAELFVERLTGYRNYGKSINQLADKYQMTNVDVKLVLTGMFHRMLHFIQQERDNYKFMSFIINDIFHTALITHSANTTYFYLKKACTIEEIAQIRGLKYNTIYDHIVEIALYDPDFPLTNYVPKHYQKEIMKAFNATSSFKLKTIKQLVAGDISYFQIRLVLASAKNLLESGD